MPHHDLLVIGTGSGNAVIDETFGDLDVALIEERKVGGTRVNFGCIPSKMLAHTADLTDAITAAASRTILRPQAATLIQLFVLALEFGIRADDLATQPYWVHPALTEVVENALLDVEPREAA